MQFNQKKMRNVFCALILSSSCIWCGTGQENILNVTQTSSIKPPTSYSYQTRGFKNTLITSGPILIIDKKNIFISNLNYDGTYSNIHFWAGAENSSVAQTLVPDENNSIDSLKAYHGQNIYIQLPGQLTSDVIHYLAVGSMENKTSIGHVLLYPNDTMRKTIPEALGFHQRTKEDRTIFRVPKCCPFNQVLSTNNKCELTDKDFKIVGNIFLSNKTHIDPDRFMNNTEFVPYEYRLECMPGYARISLGVTDVGLLFNASLIMYIDEKHYGILSHGEFCVETNDTNQTIFILCHEENGSNDTMNKSASMSYVYFAFLVLSTLCFFSSAVCYIFILKAKDVHKRCFIGYSTSMTVTFLCLIFLEKVNTACNFIGSLFIFSMICSFVWLACLCIDLIYMVKSYTRYSDETRLYYYIGSSLIIPFILLICSVAPDGIPDVPKSFVKDSLEGTMCDFKDVSIGLFFIPIGVLIFVCLFALVCTSYIIKNHENSRDVDCDWIRNNRDFKFMLIQCIMIYVLMTFSYIVEIVLNLADESELRGGIFISFIVIKSMQGIFVFIITGHHWGQKIQKQRINKKIVLENHDNHEMRPLGAPKKI